MPVPSPRSKLLPARGNAADLLANVAALVEGEICYAVDENAYYQKVSGALVKVTGGSAGGGSGESYDDTALAARVTTNEGDISTLETTVAGLSSYDDTALAARVTTAEGDIDALETTVAGLSNYDDTALDGRVTTAEGDIDALETTVAGLSNYDDTALDTRITTLEAAGSGAGSLYDLPEVSSTDLPGGFNFGAPATLLARVADGDWMQNSGPEFQFNGTDVYGNDVLGALDNDSAFTSQAGESEIFYSVDGGAWTSATITGGHTVLPAEGSQVAGFTLTLVTLEAITAWSNATTSIALSSVANPPSTPVTPAEGEVLAFDSATATFRATTPEAGGAAEIFELSNVEKTSAAPLISYSCIPYSYYHYYNPGTLVAGQASNDDEIPDLLFHSIDKSGADRSEELLAMFANGGDPIYVGIAPSGEVPTTWIEDELDGKATRQENGHVYVSLMSDPYTSGTASEAIRLAQNSSNDLYVSNVPNPQTGSQEPTTGDALVFDGTSFKPGSVAPDGAAIKKGVTPAQRPGIRASYSNYVSPQELFGADGDWRAFPDGSWTRPDVGDESGNPALFFSLRDDFGRKTQEILGEVEAANNANNTNKVRMVLHGITDPSNGASNIDAEYPLFNDAGPVFQQAYLDEYLGVPQSRTVMVWAPSLSTFWADEQPPIPTMISIFGPSRPEAPRDLQEGDVLAYNAVEDSFDNRAAGALTSMVDVYTSAKPVPKSAPSLVFNVWNGSAFDPSDSSWTSNTAPSENGMFVLDQGGDGSSLAFVCSRVDSNGVDVDTWFKREGLMKHGVSFDLFGYYTPPRSFPVTVRFNDGPLVQAIIGDALNNMPGFQNWNMLGQSEGPEGANTATSALVVYSIDMVQAFLQEINIESLANGGSIDETALKVEIFPAFNPVRRVSEGTVLSYDESLKSFVPRPAAQIEKVVYSQGDTFSELPTGQESPGFPGQMVIDQYNAQVYLHTGPVDPATGNGGWIQWNFTRLDAGDGSGGGPPA